MGRPKTPLEREFELHLHQQGKAPATITSYGAIVHRFMPYVGTEPLHRLTDEQVKSFFQEAFGHWKKTDQLKAAGALKEFLQFAAGLLSTPVVVNGREPLKSAPVQDARELILRQQWDVDRLLQQKERDDDLIAALGRQLVNHYLFFQSLLSHTPLDFDEVIRLSDECREIIERNLRLFLKLSALGKNLGRIINERTTVK